MATFAITYGRDEPADYHSTTPVYCASCGAAWDEDEDIDLYETVQCSVYCAEGNCARDAKAAYMREMSSSILLQHLRDAQSEISDEFQNYPVDLDEYGAPLHLIDYAKDATDRFRVQQDTGFRCNGVMLDSIELHNLRVALYVAFANLPADCDAGTRLSEQLDLLHTYAVRTAVGGAL